MAGGSTKVVLAALIGNGAIAITKFIASAITGSSAMFAEAIHSVVDTGNQGLLLYGIGRSQKPADAAHPFGYGKEIYFWSFVVAILLFALGAGISFYEGVHKFLHPEPMTNAIWNYVVLALAMAFEAVAWWIAYAEFNKVRGKLPILRAVRQSKDPALFTVLFEDTAAMLGLITAFIGVLLADQFGMLWADGAATLVIGTILASAAIFLAIETKGLLIGEAADPATVDAVAAIVKKHPMTRHLGEIRSIHFGPDDVLMVLSLDAQDHLMAGEIEASVSELERTIKENHPDIKRLFIEIQNKHDTAAAQSTDDQGNAVTNGGNIG